MKRINVDVLSVCLTIQLFLILLCLPFQRARGQDLAEFDRRLTEFTLDNGLKFIVLERHEAPVVTCLTFANVGSVDDERGRTGLAHLLEHLAFKGTKTIGTKNYDAERLLLDKLDRLFEAIKVGQSTSNPATERLKELLESCKKAQQHARDYLVHDEFSEALKRAGGRGPNASTSFDYTLYYVSLPSNKIELWMSMESDRFLNPVLREFYKEKDVVMEERRLRIDSNPVKRLLEEFRGICYRAHPYGTHIIGHMSDIESLTRPTAEQFFSKFYSPSNLTIAIVGDVDATEIQRLSDIYFGRILARPRPQRVPTVEPPQLGERRVLVEDPSQPAVVMGYHIGNRSHPNTAVFHVIADIMCLGRTSRIYASLVKEQKIAMNASGQVLAGKYPGLFIFYAFPAKGHTNEESLQAIDAQIDKLKAELVSREELRRAMTRAKVRLIRSLTSNSGLARELAYHQVITGDWRNLFRQTEAINQVTVQDVQRVAKQTFTAKNRSVGRIETTQTN